MAFHTKDEVLISGGCEENDPIMFWDLRKSNHCLRKFDWYGGVKDKDGEWITKHEEAEHSIKILGLGKPYLYSLCLSPW